MTTATHGVRNRTALVCLCGSQLYEDDRGMYCVKSDFLVHAFEPRHLSSCGWEYESTFVCAPGCPVSALQARLL